MSYFLEVKWQRLTAGHNIDIQTFTQFNDISGSLGTVFWTPLHKYTSWVDIQIRSQKLLIQLQHENVEMHHNFHDITFREEWSHYNKNNYDYVHISTRAASTIAISTTEGIWEKKAERVTKTHTVTHQYSVTAHHSSWCYTQPLFYTHLLDAFWL